MNNYHNSDSNNSDMNNSDSNNYFLFITIITITELNSDKPPALGPPPPPLQGTSGRPGPAGPRRSPRPPWSM